MSVTYVVTSYKTPNVLFCGGPTAVAIDEVRRSRPVRSSKELCGYFVLAGGSICGSYSLSASMIFLFF